MIRLPLILTLILAITTSYTFEITGEPIKVQSGGDLTVSGLSSGGFMAAILQVAHSGRIRGSANFAGGVYYCTKGDIIQALTRCMSQPENIDLEDIINKTESWSKRGLIDDTRNLRGKRTFAWTGTNDPIVTQGSSKKWEEFLKHYSADIKAVWDIECVHAYPTDDFGNEKNEFLSPFINNCDYAGAYEALKYLFYDNIIKSTEGFSYHNIYKFDQDKYSKIPGCMHNTGYAYVPTACQEQGARCPVHVMMHGCLQTYEHIGLDMQTKTHYNELAERNDIIMLYPQSVKSLGEVMNPRGCFDWWGYWDGDSENFATQKGPQVKAIIQMVEDLQKGEFELYVAKEAIAPFVQCENKPFYDTEVKYPVFPSDL